MKKSKTLVRIVNDVKFIITCTKHVTHLFDGRTHKSSNWNVKIDGDCTSAHCNTKRAARIAIKSRSEPYTSIFS